MQPGDILLCYVTGIKRWTGALEVVGPSNDTRPIWGEGLYPERLEVRPIILLDPEYSVPLEQLEGKVDFFEGPSGPPAYKFFLRQSPNLFKREADGELIFSLLKEAESNQVFLAPSVTTEKHYWIEMTNVHNRPDREQDDYALGKALWSPQKTKRGTERITSAKARQRVCVHGGRNTQKNESVK